MLKPTPRSTQKDWVFLNIAAELAILGTCARRKVGAVFVDSKNRIIATGYNGAASGAKHCTDHPCAGAQLASGTGLDQCEALHAEQNALILCKFPDEIHTVYSTTAPCIHCIKMLANTGAQRIVFREAYPHSGSKDYWEGLGRNWVHIPAV